MGRPCDRRQALLDSEEVRRGLAYGLVLSILAWALLIAIVGGGVLWLG